MHLNSLAQSNHWDVSYTTSSFGPPTALKWKAVVHVNQIAVLSGIGRSKAVAMEIAAFEAFILISDSYTARR